MQFKLEVGRPVRCLNRSESIQSFSEMYLEKTGSFFAPFYFELVHVLSACQAISSTGLLGSSGVTQYSTLYSSHCCICLLWDSGRTLLTLGSEVTFGCALLTRDHKVKSPIYCHTGKRFGTSLLPVPFCLRRHVPISCAAAWRTVVARTV